MTGSANCDIVSKGRTGFCGDKLIDVLGIEGLQRLSLIYVGKNLDSDFVACYQFVLTERSLRKARHLEHSVSRRDSEVIRYMLIVIRASYCSCFS
jgi:hypothetical protein